MDSINYEEGYSPLREECARISLAITDASHFTGAKRSVEYQRLLKELLSLRKLYQGEEIFELHSLLGLLLLRTDQQKAAVAEFKTALQLVSGIDATKNDASGIYYNMGIAYMEQNLLDEACKCFQSSIELKPHNIKSYTSMAVAKQMQGNFKKAYEILCYVLKNQKPQPIEIEKVFISLGYTLLHSKNLTEAMECADKVLQYVNLESKKALKLKGVVYHAQGLYKEAWDCCNKLFEQSPDSLEGLLLAGMLAVSEQDYRKAFSYYNKSRKIGRSYSFSLYNSIATVLSKLQKFDTALKVYHYILSIDQNPVHRNSVSKSVKFFETMQTRKQQEGDEPRQKKDERLESPAFKLFKEGSKFLDAGKLEEALAILQEAGQAEGAELVWEIDNAIGRAYHKMQNFTKAIPYFEFAAEKSNNSTSVLYNLASSLTRNREHERSLNVINRLLEIQPDFYAAKKMRAVLLGKLGKYNDSEEYLAEILEKEPQDAYSLLSMGRIHQEKGEFVKAHEYFVTLLAKEPDNEQAIISIAINYSRANDLKQAINFTKSHLIKNPNSFVLNLAMANIFRFHKKFGQAEIYYKKCAATYNREVYDGLADSICQMGRLDEALHYYEKISEMESDNSYSTYAKKSMAFIYRLKRDFAKAIDTYNEINWQADYFFATWRNVALCYAGLASKKNADFTARRGSSYFKKAMTLYETIKEKEHDNPKHCARIDSLIAELYAGKGEYARACEIYKPAMNDNYYFITWKAYSNCLILQNLFQEALDVCNYALERFSHDEKSRYIPNELPFYKENLELAINNSADAINQLLQRAAEWLNAPDLQYRDHS